MARPQLQTCAEEKQRGRRVYAPLNQRVLFKRTVVYTQGLQRSSFLVMTYFLLRDYHVLPKKELPLSIWLNNFFQVPHQFGGVYRLSIS